MTGCARRSAAMPARSRRCGPTIFWAASSRRWSTRNPFKPADYEDAVVGCTNQAGEDARNVARHAALLGGPADRDRRRSPSTGCAAAAWPPSFDAARAASCGQGALFIAGGVESMSRAPFVMAKSESAYGREAKISIRRSARAFPIRASRKASARTRWPRPPTTSRASTPSAARTATSSRRLAGEIRQRQGRRLLRPRSCCRSRCRAPRRAPAVTSTEDEHPRPNTTMDALAELKPLNKDGVVTAGNASGINDGAAALIVGNAQGRREGRRKAPRARIIGAAVAGVRAARHGARARCRRRRRRSSAPG